MQRVSSYIAWAGLLVTLSSGVQAATPVLYSQPALQSPVRADPDDLLLLPGDGLSATDRVVYMPARNARGELVHPQTSSVPVNPTASIGFADVVNASDVPNTLTIRLPKVLVKDETYAVCVLTADGDWSNCVPINDARPLWFSPDYVYASSPLANMPRMLKVIGRNLQPVARTKTRVRLSGPRTYTLATEDDSATLSRHVARVSLPSPMEPGSYAVEVSRDGENWVSLLGEVPARKFTVLANPSPAPIVKISGCAPDDDTTCIVEAVKAAGDVSRFPNGATVLFEARKYKLHNPGTWAPGATTSSKQVAFEGILVPKRVNLQGAGQGVSIVEQGTAWVTPRNARSGSPTGPISSLFSLLGDNTVQGLTFSDANIYTAASPSGHAALALGVTAPRVRGIGVKDPRLSNIVITRNEFRGPFDGVIGLGQPIDHLFFTHNTVAAYENGLYFNRFGNREPAYHYDLTDSVFANNTFAPSSHDSTIASQLSGGTRMDFSDNFADGTATRYLYHPGDRKGFRAAFFWNLGVNSEMKLISRNRILCSADKPGDGEAIVFDEGFQDDYGGFERAATVIVPPGARLDGTTVIVNAAVPRPGPLGFVGQWLQVVRGPGLGQLRKIVGFERTDAGAVFTVSPAFDVAPREGSSVVVGMQNWQTYVLDNHIDQSSPLCVNGPKKERSGGMIVFYAPTADSVIAGNEQIATGGVAAAHQYMLKPGKLAVLMFESSNELRDNRIERGPVAGGLRGLGGIRIFYTTTREPPGSPEPPVLNFGSVIAGNRIAEADDAGAIQFEEAGPVGFLNADSGCSASWNLVSAPLVFHNELRNSRGISINGRDLRQRPPTCRVSPLDSVVWHAALYGNTCKGVLPPALVDIGTSTKRICGAERADSCECLSGQSVTPVR